MTIPAEVRKALGLRSGSRVAFVPTNAGTYELVSQSRTITALDDATQEAQANEVMEQLSESEPGYVTVIVFAENYRVLRDAYKADRKTIIEVLRGLLESKEIVAERADTVRRALRRTSGGADFADSLICELGIDAGCEHTVTFDRKAAKNAGMQLVG